MTDAGKFRREYMGEHKNFEQIFEKPLHFILACVMMYQNISLETIERMPQINGTATRHGFI